MDATPDKFYYVTLPRLRMPDLSRLPHPCMPALPFSAGVVRRSLHSGRTAVEAWSAAHSLDAVLWTFALALAVCVGLGVSRL